VEIEAIRGAADRATALSRQLLSFSRREVLIPRDLDVNEVIRGMETIVRRLLRQGMELEVEYAPRPLMVRADSGQLEQVLMNLAINAVDAMPGGGVLRIRTSTATEMPRPEGMLAGDCAVLTVTDTGSGMSKEVQERLFEPFFTTKPAGQGTGLGLATTYAIVRDANGVIRVTSTLGEGSAFDVFLPISAEQPKAPEQRMSPAPALVPVRATERLLLAEDEPAIRQALARVLRSHGDEVIEASNGGEALRLAEAEPGRIDLLLSDVMMPGIGGKELAQRLRAARPDVRVILMSGYTDDELLRAELGDARHAFLQKPFAARQVVEAVRRMLDSSE
jgi:two-component system cell cycle sensor histidine kinase/response regulator CckA